MKFEEDNEKFGKVNFSSSTKRKRNILIFWITLLLVSDVKEKWKDNDWCEKIVKAGNFRSTRNNNKIYPPSSWKPELHVHMSLNPLEF